MKDLIEAFTIFAKYIPASKYAMISCEHDIMYVQCDPAIVSADDMKRLAELGFIADRDDLNNFYSYRFGSC